MPCGMGEWFRNDGWDDEIAATFEARLAKARDKAQYLTIQAHCLLATCPEVAAMLARRAINLNDPAQNPSQKGRAGLYLGTALAMTGAVDAAIEALEAAVEAQAREPAFRTPAHLDQALLIAAAKREALYPLAWARLAEERSVPVDERTPSALIAIALIGAATGHEVAAEARLAIEILADGTGTIVGPDCLSAAALTRRLAVIAAPDAPSPGRRGTTI